jgi:hypothetical protein
MEVITDISEVTDLTKRVSYNSHILRFIFEEKTVDSLPLHDLFNMRLIPRIVKTYIGVQSILYRKLNSRPLENTTTSYYTPEKSSDHNYWLEH